MDVGKGDQWEVVGGKKSGGKNLEPLSKSKKKALRDKMPTIQPSAPVEESSTIYEAFIKNEERKEKRKELQQQQGSISGQAAGSSSGGGNTAKKNPAPSAKRDNKGEKKDKPMKLEEAVKNVDVNKFEQWLSKIKVQFPNHPDLWLKDLASLLNNELCNVTDIDPVFSNKPSGYPLTKLPENLKKLMLNTFEETPREELPGLVKHCIDRLLEESNRSTSTIGYRMFIQLVVSHHPWTVVDYVNTYIDLVDKNVNRPIRALSILWSVGQAGLSNLVSGLKVWLEIMLPVMNMRNLSNYCVLYLENLLEIHTGSLSSSSEGLPKKEFFRLFDLLFADQSELTLDVRSRMKELYPKLKIIAWGDDSSSTLHNLFSSFLTRCQPDCSPRKKSELLGCLMDCLTADPQSFGIWRHTYTRHMDESSVLLKHLTDNFDKITVNRKLLYETVRAFHRTNEQLAEDLNFTKSRASASRCITLCEELLNKLSAPKFPLKKLVSIVMLVLVSVVLCDIVVHGGIKKSLSFRTLEEYGVLAFLKHLWQRSLIYCSIIYEWLLVNVPYYYSKISEIVGPYVSLVWEKLVYAVVTIADSLRPTYEYVKSQIPAVIKWLEEKLPVVLEFIALYIGVVLTTIVNLTVWLCHLTSYYAVLLWNWLEQNILTGSWSVENIYSSLSNALLVLQSYIHRFYLWCYSQVSS